MDDQQAIQSSCSILDRSVKKYFSSDIDRRELALILGNTLIFLLHRSSSDLEDTIYIDNYIDKLKKDFRTCE